MTVSADRAFSASAAAALVDSGGTMWRLRSLVAMGHDTGRIARALREDSQTVEEILTGEAHSVAADLRDLACQPWDAWWDKHPPEQTDSQRTTAAAARRRAEQSGWCPPLGLDEDELDEPGYRPYSRYRAATGTGIAGEFVPRLPAPATGGAASGYQARHDNWPAGGGASPPRTPATVHAGGLGGRRT